MGGNDLTEASKHQQVIRELSKRYTHKRYAGHFKMFALRRKEPLLPTACEYQQKLLASPYANRGLGRTPVPANQDRMSLFWPLDLVGERASRKCPAYFLGTAWGGKRHSLL